MNYLLASKKTNLKLLPNTLQTKSMWNWVNFYSWTSNFLSQPLNGHFPSCFSTQFVMQWSWKTWSHFPNFATHSPVLFADRHWMHWSMMWCWQIAHFSILVSYSHVAMANIFFTSKSFLGWFWEVASVFLFAVELLILIILRFEIFYQSKIKTF